MNNFIKSNRTRISNIIAMEDMKELQKKITGKSVYKKPSMQYQRKQKHTKNWLLAT